MRSCENVFMKVYVPVNFIENTCSKYDQFMARTLRIEKYCNKVSTSQNHWLKAV